MGTADKGTFTVVQLCAVECWILEFGLQIFWPVLLTHPLICRSVNSKKGKLTRLLYTHVSYNSADINRNCLWVRRGWYF
jgi:hypothetical protein